MKDFVTRMKAKPEHVRKRIALGASAGVTAFVGIAWFTTLAATGAFSIAPGGTLAADAPEAAPVALTNTNVKSNFSQLVGAVGAATNGTSTQPALKIIDGNTTSSFKTATTTNPSATVIPF